MIFNFFGKNQVTLFFRVCISFLSLNAVVVCFAGSPEDNDMYGVVQDIIKNGWWVIQNETNLKANVRDSRLELKLSEALEKLDYIERPWTFEKLYFAFHSEENEDKQILILSVLAASRDPRSGKFLMKVYNSDDEYDQNIKKISFDYILRCFITPHIYGGGTHQDQIKQWWKENKEIYEAISLPEIIKQDSPKEDGEK